MITSFHTQHKAEDLNHLVSVIVPCYNQGKYLKDALESVFNQTYQNWECIIVDDGSTDNTKSVSEEWFTKDKRYKYFSKENGGLSSARNYGITNANGIFILPLDADDIIHKDYLLLAIKYFTNYPSTKLVYCKAKRFGLENRNWNLKNYNYETLLVQNIIFCSAVYKTDDYKSITTGYDEQMLNGYEDWDFWIQLLDKNDKVHQLDKVLFYYRIKEKSTIFTNDVLEISKRKYIYRKHIEKYLKYLPDPIFLAQQNELINTIYKDSYAYKIGFLLLKPIKKILSFFRLYR